MTFYIARQPDDRFALFDDLSIAFVATGLSVGEAAAAYRNATLCGPRQAWSEMQSARLNIPLGRAEHSPDRPRARMDDLLNAVSMILGRSAMRRELRSMGAPGYEPDAVCSAAVLELWDCFEADDVG